MIISPNRLLIEQNFITQLSIYLPKFRWNSTQKLANFRCVVCNDSKKNSHLKRGFIFVSPKKTNFIYKCHNCDYSNNLLFFLKDYYPALYNNLKMELLADALGTKKFEAHVKVEEPDLTPKNFNLIKTNTKKVSDLYYQHEAYQYCINRDIPVDKLDRILFTDDFKKYVHEYFPDDTRKFPSDKRILFELRDRNNNLFAVQSRIISGDGLRFLTIKMDEAAVKIYGLDIVNTNLPIIITEGIIDSLFLDNTLALCGGDPINGLDVMLDTKKTNIYMVLDNEPRNKDTINRMNKAIEYGYNVYFWDIPSNLKDINKMVEAGISPEYIQNNILTKSLNGFLAKMKMATWKKI